MARNKRKGGRVTPRGTRPPNLRVVGTASSEWAGSPIDTLIDSGAAELLDAGDALSAETWGSGVLDVFEHARWKARLEGTEVPPFEQALLERCGQRRDVHAAVVTAAFASVAPPPHDRLATAVASQLHRLVDGLPAWVAKVGHVTATRGWMAGDVFGDQDSLVLGYRQEGTPDEHALVVLVDHNLSGQAKDAWLAPDFADVVRAWTSTGDPHLRWREVPLDDALGRLRDAMAASEEWDGDTDLRTEDFARHRALIRARLRRAGLADDRPVDLGVGEDERQDLVHQFMASPQGRQLSGEPTATDVEILARALVDLRCDHEGRPLRWSPAVVALLLGDLVPRKLLLHDDQATAFPAVVRAFVRFSAERAGLDDAFTEETLAAIDQLEPEYLDAMDDPAAAAGPAKALLAALEARGVDLDDMDAINRALDRDDPVTLPAAPKHRRRTAAAPVDVVASAQSAPALARIDALAAFYGDGRKLTQTGQPTLADARELVARLETTDQFDLVIGDRTFKTRSAAELPELAFTVRWALTAGALRKEHGKLRATATWRSLGDKSMKRWARIADALPTLGPLAAFHAGNRYRNGDEVLDELAPYLLRLLAEGPTAFDAVLDAVCEEADEAFEWLAPYLQDRDDRRKFLGWDLDLFIRILGWAGITDRIGARAADDPYDVERVIGGTLRLTPAGRWWLGGD